MPDPMLPQTRTFRVPHRCGHHRLHTLQVASDAALERELRRLRRHPCALCRATKRRKNHA